MAKTSGEDNLHNIKNNVDKEFNEWRQPVPPKSPKSPPEFGEGHSEPTVQAKSVCGVKDLYRLSRKRRTVLSARNSRLCSRRRNENKESVSNAEAKPRITKKGWFIILYNVYSSPSSSLHTRLARWLTSYLKAGIRVVTIFRSLTHS